MQRYQDITVLNNSQGIRYYATVKYPEIPVDQNDIYFISSFGDRVDLVANDFYQDVTLYWIIMVANGLSADSIFIPPGTQVRVPANTSAVIQAYNDLNSQ